MESNLGSDSISIYTCKSCNGSIDELSKIECDECKNQFHESCLNFNGNSSNPDLIQLCTLCSGDNQIYSPKQQRIKKSPSKSLIPVSTSVPNVKSLRSRTITINGNKSIKPKKTGKHTESTKSNESEIIAQLEAKITALEARMSSFGSTQCKCSEITDAKIAKLEGKIKEYHEFVVANFSQFTQSPNLISSELDFKSDFDIDSLRFRLHFADKIGDIERTIKEDRLLVEQLFINQMDTIQKQMKTQEQIIESYEALMQLNASNDSSIPEQFDDLKSKLNDIGKTIEFHDTILHHLDGIISRHNNTLVTHFELNKAYCADIISKSLTTFDGLNTHKRKHRRDKEAIPPQRNGNNNHTQSLAGSQTERAYETNETNAKPTQRHSGANNNKFNGCLIHTQPLRMGHQRDFQRIRIHVRNQNTFRNEAEVCDSIGQTLMDFSSEYNTFKFVTCGLKYDSNTRALTECSLIMLLPKPINVNEFNRFLSQRGFQISAK